MSSVEVVLTEYIAWKKDEDGKTVYDTEHMQNEFEDELEQLIIEEHNERQG